MTYKCVSLSLSISLQEEHDLLFNATFKGDMEVVTRLSNDGVDMNAYTGNVVCVSVVSSVYTYIDVAMTTSSIYCIYSICATCTLE